MSQIWLNLPSTVITGSNSYSYDFARPLPMYVNIVNEGTADCQFTYLDQNGLYNQPVDIPSIYNGGQPYSAGPIRVRSFTITAPTASSGNSAIVSGSFSDYYIPPTNITANTELTATAANIVDPRQTRALSSDVDEVNIVAGILDANITNATLVVEGNVTAPTGVTNAINHIITGNSISFELWNISVGTVTTTYALVGTPTNSPPIGYKWLLQTAEVVIESDPANNNTSVTVNWDLLYTPGAATAFVWSIGGAATTVNGVTGTIPISTISVGPSTTTSTKAVVGTSSAIPLNYPFTLYPGDTLSLYAIATNNNLALAAALLIFEQTPL